MYGIPFISYTRKTDKMQKDCFDDNKFYGSTTVGEKGQVVLPTDLRRDLKIETGEKLAVLVIKHMGFEGICMVKSNLLITIIEKFFGGKLNDLIKKDKPLK